ncbi:hypothetical protein TI39_contig350g00004 [Zymoseptoria brevis]|uniref:Uncharacterized protein n=1 Tax=Zymoseptoria brevis TaxID=1047168 RepID=A0A0F4GUG1_9PEZI|nr:hypothetical protein TI39_contig350g00004 [Zymoseptoria brevis]
MASSKLSTILSSLLPLALCTIAFAFAITATISREWAVRHNYSEPEADWSQANLIRTETRSPFVVCGTVGETYVCTQYTGSGSCKSLAALDDNQDATYGDERLCQQIHWAGRLAVASTTFIGIGFGIALCMSLVATLALLSPAVLQAEDTDEQRGTTTDPKMESNVVVTQRRRPRPHRKQKYLSPMAPYINALLVAVLITGAILYVLAQFYGVLAFVQSAPDNGAFAAYGGNTAPGEAKYMGPWIQGKALSVYGSVAWFAAVLTALSAAWVWRLPSGRQSPL